MKYCIVTQTGIKKGSSRTDYTAKISCFNLSINDEYIKLKDKGNTKKKNVKTRAT